MKFAYDQVYFKNGIYPCREAYAQISAYASGDEYLYPEFVIIGREKEIQKITKLGIADYVQFFRKA